MKIQRHTELEVYKKAFDAAMLIFEGSKKFPKEEIYSLTNQVRRSSGSVCANLAEAWRKRRYKRPSSPNFPMLKAKLRRRRYGSTSLLSADICSEIAAALSCKVTMKF
jgi:23S rRNA-intervening sequence protein